MSEICHESNIVLTLKGLFSKNVLFNEECLRAVTNPNPKLSPTKNVCATGAPQKERGRSIDHTPLSCTTH